MHGPDFRADLKVDEKDPGNVKEEAAIARSIIDLQAGKLRSAYFSLQGMSENANDKAVRSDAALLNALIFAKANIWPLSRPSTLAVVALDPDNRAAKCLLDMMADRKISLFTKQSSKAHPKHGGIDIDFYRGSPSSAQPAVLVFRNGENFHGALALESRAAEDKKIVYLLNFYDLEGLPLQVAFFGESRPTEETIQAFAEDFNPQFGKGRYTIMRAELEALRAHEMRITPLAARWADYAGGKMIEESVKKPLQEAQAWNWKHAGVQECGPSSSVRFDMVSYLNQDAPSNAEDIAKTSGTLEYMHFVIHARNPAVFLGSYSVGSEQLKPGERIYFLKRIVAGQGKVLNTYPSLPALDRVADEIRKCLADSPVVAGGADLAGATLVLKNGVAQIDAALTNEDGKDTVRTSSMCKVYTVKLDAQKTYQIDMRSKQIDSYLRLEDAAGKELAHDDDSGDGLDARIIFTCTQEGTYRIIATTYLGGFGPFTLSVKQNANGKQATLREIVLKEGVVEVASNLTNDDAKDTVRTGSVCKVYILNLSAGKTYQIDMKSQQIDSYLRLENATGKQLAQDDDSGGYPDARIIFQCREAGTYRIVATTFVQALGGFTLTVREK